MLSLYIAVTTRAGHKVFFSHVRVSLSKKEDACKDAGEWQRRKEATAWESGEIPTVYCDPECWSRVLLFLVQIAFCSTALNCQGTWLGRSRGKSQVPHTPRGSLEAVVCPGSYCAAEVHTQVKASCIECDSHSSHPVGK